MLFIICHTKCETVMRALRRKEVVLLDFETLKSFILTGTVQPKTDICADAVQRLKKLEKPQKRVDVIIDTDAYNEADDQFAIAYALKLSEAINIQAFYAAPFINQSTYTPQEGMKKSYDEILHVLALAGETKYSKLVFQGSGQYLDNEHTPVLSPAVDDLIARGMSHQPDDPLYVIAIGAITNIASALLLEPRLKEHLVVIWHGGAALDLMFCNSFNACQDIAATRVVMGSGVPFVMQPGSGVAFNLTTTEPELEYWLAGKNPLCDYLIQRVKDVVQNWKHSPVWSHPLVDVATLSWLLQDKVYMHDRLCPTPLIGYNGYYEFDSRRPLMRYVYSMNRDAILSDLFARISQ